MDFRCFACMNITEDKICPHCGHDNSGEDNFVKGLLKPGTLINNRYYIGLHTDKNGEGITYIAFDTEKMKRIRLREFFPNGLCYRANDGTTIQITLGCEIQYKSLLTDFSDLSKQLIALEDSAALVHAIDVFSENGTIYTVYEDVQGVSFAEYLVEQAGEISWDAAKELFLPLLYTVKQLNEHGIIHRGISPTNIIVTPNGSLKLKGICTSAVRAINAEITHELYSGYTAPEQYSKCSNHGEWTDVYALSAVLYKALTGTSPMSAESRSKTDDDLIPPINVVSTIPKNVSEALVRGLTVDTAYRTLYIKDLINQLYTFVDSNSVFEETTVNKTSKRFFGDRIPLWLLVIVIALPLMLAVFFIAYFSLVGGNNNISGTISYNSDILSSSDVSSDISSEESSSSEEISSITSGNVVVDSFIGKAYSDIENSEFYAKLFKFKKKEVFSDTVSYGEIIEQSVESESIVATNTEITLTVSKGAQYVTLAPIIDSDGNVISLADYQLFLKDNNLEHTVKTESSEGVAKGVIVRIDPDVGTVVDRNKTTSVTIYVAQ